MEYFNKTINDSFENAIEKLQQLLKRKGFGVPEIGLKATLKKETGCAFTITPF
jgi:uncharacterized protein (DUF302 family)